MRTPVTVLVAALATAALPIPSQAQQLAPAVRQLQVHAQPGVPDLVCETRAYLARGLVKPNPDPLEVPSDELVQSAADDAPASASTQDGHAGAPAHPLSGAGYRIAIWGDSHLAAGFITDELAHQLKFPTDSVSNVLLPANMGKAGVRLPIRRSCVSSQWKYEPGYLGGDNAVAPGPGLVNMFADQPGATLAWDVRTTSQSPGYDTVRILYQQTDAPLVVGISVDGAAETQVTLDQRPGPAVLELVGDQPVAQVRLRLIDGRLRLHGLDLRTQQANPYEMDVFGYPGATVASWKSAQLDYLRAWFGGRDYQLVMLEFGTNEGNVKPFDLAAYRRMLTASVQNMRTLFPDAACLLIAPGDRGVLVPRSANKKSSRRKKGQGGAHIDLYQYSRIHAAIGEAQRAVAAEAGCGTWSMLDAMGGPGKAYEWAHQAPPLMAKDLIHFTVGGYQRFAQKLVKDMDWTTVQQDSGK